MASSCAPMTESAVTDLTSFATATAPARGSALSERLIGSEILKVAAQIRAMQ